MTLESLVNEPRVYTLAQIAEILSAEIVGDKEHRVSGLADLKTASSNEISFLASAQYENFLATSSAGAVLLKPDSNSAFAGNKLLVANPYLAFARLSAIFTRRPKQKPGIHPSAVIESGANIDASAAVGPNCFVGADAHIGADCELYAGAVVGQRTVLGAGCTLYNNVVLYHDTVLGERVAVHANTTIGSDGFGYAPSSGAWIKIHQLGRVVIGNDVEIGANCAIDRGALGDTEIADGVIIDNQVHIAHNVRIGKNTAIAGCVGIAGSAVIGANCQIAGMVAINGHIEIADNTIFHGGTVVTRGNKEAGVFASAAPLQDVEQWRKNSVRFRNLDELFRRVKKLESDSEK